MKKNYTAIILDIQHSRKFDDDKRLYIQDKLFSIIKFINDYCNKELVKKFEFSAGDSVQALFYNISDAFSCYCFIKNLFYPYQIRCGIGYGKINQKLMDQNYVSTNMLDGEAYHYAISALDDCKLEKYDFLIYSSNEERDYFVNQIMSTVELLNLDHTYKQADIFNLFNLLYPLEIRRDGMNIKEISTFIINKLKENVLSYKFEDFTSSGSIKLILGEVTYNYQERKKQLHKLFDQRFSTKINSVCAVLLNVSRQNIEKMRVVGKFDEIRKLECLVLEYIRNEYEHEKKD